MSTRIRLRRMGANKRPFFRVVVADQRSPRDGRFIENIGRYHPMDDPSVIEIDRERALHWLRVGAQPSSQVRHLLDRVGIWEAFVAERPSAAIAPKPGRAEKPQTPKLSKKAAAKASAPVEAPAAPVEAPAAPVEAPAAPAAEAPADDSDAERDTAEASTVTETPEEAPADESAPEGSEEA